MLTDYLLPFGIFTTINEIFYFITGFIFGLAVFIILLEKIVEECIDHIKNV